MMHSNTIPVDLERSARHMAKFVMLRTKGSHEHVERAIAAALATHLAPWASRSHGSEFDEREAVEVLSILRRQLGLDDPVLICAFILVERCILASAERELLTPSNWEALLVTATLLAIKV